MREEYCTTREGHSGGHRDRRELPSWREGHAPRVAYCTTCRRGHGDRLESRLWRGGHAPREGVAGIVLSGPTATRLMGMASPPR